MGHCCSRTHRTHPDPTSTMYHHPPSDALLSSAPQPSDESLASRIAHRRQESGRRRQLAVSEGDPPVRQEALPEGNPPVPDALKAPLPEGNPPVPDALARVVEDEATAVAEAAKPLPEGSTWHRWGGNDLELLLAHTTIIDAAWLLKFARGEVMPERNGVVPAWQDLPPEAKLSLAKLRQTTMALSLPVAVLSYGWASSSHPDPTGEQLQQLLPVLESMADSVANGPSSRQRHERTAAWGIVWDFMSLPQRGYTSHDADGEDRTEYELERFKRGLRHINVWYSAVYVTTLVCDWPMPTGAQNPQPISQRGWCIFEQRLSNVRKHGSRCLKLSQMPKGPGVTPWGKVETTCQAGRLPPLAPHAFEAMMRDGMAREATQAGTGYRFTNGKDATAICIPQYRESFARLMRLGGSLSYEMCRWGAEEAAVLAEALEAAHEMGVTTTAFNLGVASNRLPDSALPPIIRAIECGALPQLRTLMLEGNQVGDAGVRMLAPLLGGQLSHLEELGLGKLITTAGVQVLGGLWDAGGLSKLGKFNLQLNSQMGDEGAAVVARALRAGCMPRLNTLYLNKIGMGDAGADALAAAVAGAPKLQLMVVGGNSFGERAANALKEACARVGGKAHKTYFDEL